MIKHKSIRRSAARSGATEAHDDPHRLAAAYLRVQRHASPRKWDLRFWRDEWWVWNGRCYRRQADHDVRADLTKTIKSDFDRWAKRKGHRARRNEAEPSSVPKVTRSVVSNALQALTGLVLVRAEVEQPAWLGTVRPGTNLISLANGIVDLDRIVTDRKKAVGKHSPDWFSSVCLPYSFAPAATCPRWRAFLDQMFEGDAERIALVQEWFGYCLMPDTSLQKCLMLVGEGANGKSVALATLVALIGQDNVSHVPLESFEDRFQLTPTLGKLANIVADVGDLKRVPEGRLKSYITGEPMYFDRKNREGISARPTARLVLATNALPPLADRSQGIWRRLCLLPCNATIPPNQQDRFLSEKLRDELSGIFNWSIQGYRRLLERRQFTEPALSQQLLDQHRLESNPARAFLQECVEEDENAMVRCALAYQAYKSWSSEGGYAVLNDGQFGKEVARTIPKARRVRASGLRGEPRPWSYSGIRLRTPCNPEGT